MKKRLCIIAAGSAMLLAACNPVRYLEMINETGIPARMVFHIKEDSLLVSPFYLNNTEQSGFALGANPPFHHIQLSFHHGAWTKAYLRDVVDDLEKIEISSAAGELVLDTTEAMTEYLWQRKQGITGRKIRVVLKAVGKEKT